MAAFRVGRPTRFFVTWYRKHGRKFPWRDPQTSPFQLLLAEFLLRRTGAAKVATVWSHFAAHYPTPQAVVATSEERLINDLRPLGLYRQRAKALIELSRTIIIKHGGNVPTEEPDLIVLPYVGHYIASAVRVFAYGQRDVVIDGSVIRLYSRILGLGEADPQRSTRVIELARSLVPANARDHAYGVLDFAAQVCLPGIPRCSACPLAGTACRGFERGANPADLV